MDSTLLRLRLGVHKDNMSMIVLGVLGVVIPAIYFLAASNVFITTAARISSGAYFFLLLYFVFVKKRNDTSTE